MTDQTSDEPENEETLIADLDLLHSLSDIYANLKGRKNRQKQHDATLDNLENQIHLLTNSVLESISNG